jgi:hypothetical protein
VKHKNKTLWPFWDDYGDDWDEMRAPKKKKRTLYDDENEGADGNKTVED